MLKVQNCINIFLAANLFDGANFHVCDVIFLQFGRWSNKCKNMSARKRPAPRRTRRGREPRTWNRFWPARASPQTWQHMRGRSICTRTSQASRLLLGQRTLARHRTLLSGTWSTPETLAVCVPHFLSKCCYQTQANSERCSSILALFFVRH